MAVLFDEQGNYTGPQDLNDPALDPTKAPPGRGAEVTAARNAALEKKIGLSPEVQAMSGPERFGRAAYGALAEPVYGALEKAELAFPGKGQAAETAARIGQERSARHAGQRDLEATPGGMFGGFVGKGLPYTLATSPAGVAGIAGVTGFLGGGPDEPTGAFNEFGQSAAQGAADALTAYLPAKGFQALGKVAGASTGKMTKEGLRAKEIEEAAKRLGLPRPSFGQVYPGGAIERLEETTGAQHKLVNEQAEALYAAITKDTPYGVGDVGGKYLDELKKAVANRYNAGSAMYKKVDDIVQSNGLGKFMPGYTANVVTNARNPGYTLATEELGKYGLDIGSMSGMKARDLAKIPLSFENFNSMRVATNKAWGNINRQIDTARAIGNPPAAELKAARDYLGQMRTALDNDAERWARQNAGNREAVDAFKEAAAYWKEQVVPTVVENPFARKVASQRRGFPTGESATRLSTSTANTPLVDRLLPTMSDQGADMTAVLRTLPAVRAKVLTGEAEQMPRGPLHALAQAVEGRRDSSLLERIAAMTPGLRPTMNSTPVRRLAGAEDLVTGNPLARIPAYGLGVPVGSGALQDYATGRLRAHGE